jgi:hypothetical protein
VDWFNRVEERDKIRAILRMGSKISGIAKVGEFLD